MGQQSNKRKAGAALGARPSSRGGNKKQQQQRSKPPATAANKKRRGDLYEAEETVADEEVHARKYDVSCWCCVRAWRRRDAHTLAHNKHTYTASGERVCDLEGDNFVARPHRRQLSTE